MQSTRTRIQGNLLNKKYIIQSPCKELKQYRAAKMQRAKVVTVYMRTLVSAGCTFVVVETCIKYYARKQVRQFTTALRYVPFLISICTDYAHKQKQANTTRYVALKVLVLRCTRYISTHVQVKLTHLQYVL